MKIAGGKSGKFSPVRFARDRSGGVAVRAALVFGAAGLAMALLVTPMMQGAATHFAQNQSPGVDRMITGSVQSDGRYIIRKSVLSDQPEVICGSRLAAACPAPTR